MSRNNRFIKRFLRDNMSKIIQVIKEAQAIKTLSGEDKLDYAVRRLNKLIDIPLLPEYIEEMIFKTAITAVVELAKSLWGDKDWFEGLQELVNKADEATTA
ncbi:MAG: hypothetical protein V3U11_03115 [Planctomycetota bacterium]